MRGYLTAKAFGKLYKKSPKLAYNILGIVILFWGIALLNIFGMYGSWAGISYFLIVSGSLIIIITIICLIISSINKKKQEQLLNDAILSTGINQIDSLSPYEFEDWVTRFLNIYGYDATTTKRSGDFGADVIAFKGNTKIVVSCKKYVGNLGIKCVQEIIGAMDYYNANEGWVCSTSPHFSRQAYDLARSRGVKLFTKNDLALMLNKLQQENKGE